MLISIVLIAIFAVGAVSAANENITDTADEILSAESTNGLEAAQPEDFSELVGLIKSTSSGQTLNLEKDYINDGTYTKGILISKKMTIDGQGHTLDANEKSNIFRISNNQVVLKNINFINGKSADYSAVYGNCTVINCSFTECTSGIYGGALNQGDAYNCYFEYCSAPCGGAIYQGNAYNCSFVACLASKSTTSPSDVTDYSGYGGAIYQGNAYDCSFIECVSVYGGAIYQGNAYNSYFEECFTINWDWTVGFGGAIYQGNAYDCSFVGCNAYSGGAINNGDAYNSSFTGCWAQEGPSTGGSGGGITKGNAYNCSFVGCSASEGGAIYYGDAHNCYFEECTSYDEPGNAIYIGDAYDSKFIDCTYDDKAIIYKGNYTNCIFIPFTFSCSNLSVNYGEGGKLQIRTLEGYNDMPIVVKIYKDNKLINSFASTTGSDLPIDAAPGNYIIELTSEYANPLNVSVTVNKGSPKLALANDFAKSGETANVKVTMSKKAAGFARITINGETYRVQISSGVASVDVPNLADGVYTVTATYNGNAYHTAETITDTFHVGKSNQGIKLKTNNIKVGETERLTATLAKDATGFVRFIIGDDTYKVAIENGAAYVDIKDLKAGTYSITLKYNGNYKYNAESVLKTFTVSKSSPGIRITANNIYVGRVATIKVNLAKDVPGNVWITVNGESHKVPISNGVATLTLFGLKAGNYDVSVKYGGNYKYLAETKAASFNVIKSSPGLTVLKTTVDGKTVLTANIAEDATGNVNFLVNGNTYKAKITNGVATLTLPDMAPGTYTFKSTYNGNYKYLAETKTRSITIK